MTELLAFIFSTLGTVMVFLGKVVVWPEYGVTVMDMFLASIVILTSVWVAVKLGGRISGINNE